ncbi:hypothetical protein BsWGS_27176 [Bradybaena similaris]
MAVIIKAYLEEADRYISEVRYVVVRLPFSLTSPDSNAGIFNETVARVRSAFPALTDKIFAIKWKDAEGDQITMSSDNEMMLAISQTRKAPLKVLVTAKMAVMKVYLKSGDTAVEVHRIPFFWTSPESNTGIFNETVAKVRSAFPALTDKIFDLMWKDAEGDLIKISSDEEMMDAISQSQNAPLKVKISVDGMKVIGPSGHYFGPMGPCGQSFGPMGHGGNFPGPFGLQGPNFGHREGYGHRFGPHGFPGLRGGHHFGQFMGMDGPFESHHFSEDESPCSSACHEEKHEESNLKANLRQDAVPEVEKCQARIGIHNRRFITLKNATSTSSDSEQKPPTMEADSVPEAKLDVDVSIDIEKYSEEREKLKDAVPGVQFRWARVGIHKGRCINLKNSTSASSDSEQEPSTVEAASVPEAKLDVDVRIDTEKDSKEREKLKDAVPGVQIRWARVGIHKGRYINLKNSTSASSDSEQEPSTIEAARMPEAKLDVDVSNNTEKDSEERENLKAFVPAEHRVWAEKFIHDWRQEHNILEPGAGNVEVLLENEAAEKETGQRSCTTSEYYTKWMRKFLARWHLPRGQIDRQKVDAAAGEKGEFKYYVSKNFREWVKCFMDQKYGKVAEKEEANTFQKLEKCLAITSSDEEPHAGVSSHTSGNTMKSSLQKLNMVKELNGVKKNVWPYERANAVTSDSGSSDEANPQFQHQRNTMRMSRRKITSPKGEQNPAYVLMTLQMKRMKAEHKLQKRTIKAIEKIFKAQKHKLL